MPTKPADRKLRFSPIPSAFVVVDATSITVATALQLLEARRVSWLVAPDSETLCLVSKKELRSLHDGPAGATTGAGASLAEIHRLGHIQASTVLSSERSTLDLPANQQARHSQTRAVVVRAVASRLRGKPPVVRAIGKLVMKEMKAQPAVQRPKLHPIGYTRPPSITSRGKQQPFTVIEVFYATDRESIPVSSPNKFVRYENKLPLVANVDYGICQVTVPKSHVPRLDGESAVCTR